jgi:hypothetical protein
VLKSGKCDETLAEADCKNGFYCYKGICYGPPNDFDPLLPTRCRA